MNQNLRFGAQIAGCGPLLPQGTRTDRPLRQQIFECVRAAGALPRVDVARALDVSPGSVTTITGDLIDTGHLSEARDLLEDGESHRGRPRVALRVSGEKHYVVGLKLSDWAHSAVICDFAGNQIAEAAHERKVQMMSTDDLLLEAEFLLDKVLDGSGLTRADVSAIGLGVPGYVENAGGTVLWSPLLRERDQPLAHQMQAHLGIPVHVDNDANLVTLAELWFGEGRALSDFAVVTIEHGVGMGLVVDHRLYYGGKGLGMELGHTKVQLDGALCRCGQRGCLEAYVADYALAREAATALNWTNRDGFETPVLLDSLYTHAKAGNTAARSIFKRAGRYLSLGLANIINLFDPPLILISGDRMRFDYLHGPDVITELELMALNTGRDLPRVEPHAWGDLVWARGAAALALAALTDETLG